MNELNCWMLLRSTGVDCLESPPEGYYGFTYLIRVRDKPGVPRELVGKIYVGKKAFTHTKRTALSKRAKKTTRKRIKVTQIDSQWLNYYGSSKELLEDIKKYGKDKFERYVLEFCRNKSDLSYSEAKFQFSYNVMFVPSYNSWISLKVFKKNLI